jgi:hypothetical protein
MKTSEGNIGETFPLDLKGGAGTIYSRQGQADRLIAAGRVVLAAFSLFAIWLHPSEPARYAHLTFALLSGYLTYALILTLITWKLEVLGARGRLITHALDLMVFALIMFFTERPVSPFFGFFIFSLAAATLRWQWRGTLWTAAAALAAVILMSLYPTDLFRAPNFEIDDFIIRLVYLAVVAILLGSLGAYEQKLGTDLSRLAAWPHTISGEAPGMVREMLEHAASALGALRILLAWEEKEEPWLFLGLWSKGEFQFTRESPAVFGSLVPEGLAGRSFFCPDSRSPSPTAIYSSPEGLQRRQGSPLSPGLQGRFDINSVLERAG